jgi:hypothetical protein
MKRFLIVALLALDLAGCTTMSSINPFSKGGPDIKASQEVRSKWSGKPAEEFFAKLGPPVNKIPTSGGDVVYVWSKRETDPGMSYFCDLKMVANSRGNLTDIQITGVSAGKSHSNYCDDISW